MKGIKEFIEKYRGDAGFVANYSRLDSTDTIITKAKADGYTITAEEIEAAIQKYFSHDEKTELNEDDLAVVAGGGHTKNMYDPNSCPGKTKADAACCPLVDYSKGPWCDHFRREQQNWTLNKKALGDDWAYRIICVMGSFDYIGDRYCAPE